MWGEKHCINSSLHVIMWHIKCAPTLCASDVLCTNVIAVRTVKIVAISVLELAAEAAQKSNVSATYTMTIELMMKEFVSADGPIFLCTLHSCMLFVEITPKKYYINATDVHTAYSIVPYMFAMCMWVNDSQMHINVHCFNTFIQ